MRRCILVFLTILLSLNFTKATIAEEIQGELTEKSIEEKKFELDQKKLEHDIKIAEQRLKLDQQNSKVQNGFLQKNFGVILTSIISLVAIIISFLQLIAKKEETKKVNIQKDKEIRIAEISNERDWNHKAIEFVAQNQDVIFGEDTEKRDKIAKVMLATFPPAVTNVLFQKFEYTAKSDEAKQVWISNQEVAIKQLIVRVDGLYYREVKDGMNYNTYLLRFYEDGTAVGVTVTGKIENIAQKVAKWLVPNENESEGKYVIIGRKIEFSLTSEYGTVDYKGEIRSENELDLKVHSHINGYKSNYTYYFYKI